MQMKVRVIIFVRAAVFEPAALTSQPESLSWSVIFFFPKWHSLLITLINLFRFSQQPFKSLAHFCFYLFKYPNTIRITEKSSLFPFLNNLLHFKTPLICSYRYWRSTWLDTEKGSWPRWGIDCTKTPRKNLRGPSPSEWVNIYNHEPWKPSVTMKNEFKWLWIPQNKRRFLVRDESVSHSIPGAPASTQVLARISQAGTKWPTQCSFSPANSSWILITRNCFFLYSVVLLRGLLLFVLLSQQIFSGFSASETRLTANFVYSF